ncbi:GNAT family protein [uncultured Pontibacter sp.]|uniref:GNAT family N-acetyltransferase n=1 Tax=uncultured Pontibacter sp. TaxID=453356 RepID=UPI00261B29D6|nr:GNAT family protein [uncultured Pontibacter sp.]
MRISKTFTIETERLLLRISKVDDIPFVFSATRFEGFNDGMVWDAPETPDELISVYENIEKAWNEDSAYSFTIINKDEDSLVGKISIRREAEPDIWNIGFWTHPEQQNKGYMTESTKAVINFGFEILAANKIVACHALWNKKSERVLKKVGMFFSRYIEKGYLKRGQWIQENLLEINKVDWKR